MAYNYYQVVQSRGDELEFKPKLITHWNEDIPGHYIDLRYPGGQRAFHTRPTDEPYTQNLSGYAVSDASYNAGDVDVVKPPEFKSGGQGVYHASKVLGFSFKKLLDPTVPNRKAEAARIASDPGALVKQLGTVLDALTFNNPVILYSGFSMSRDEPIHLILLVGYAYLNDDSGRHLWLVVADPATHENKITAGMFFPPCPNEKDDLKGLARLSGKHDLIRLIPGDWDHAVGALVLIRARKLFEENTVSTVKDDLYMDYISKDSPGARGGSFIYSHKVTPVPSNFVFSNVARSVAYPFDTQKERLRPVNYYALTERAPAGRFPLGSHQNLHSGVHLNVSSFPKPPPPAPSPTEEQKAPLPMRGVHCLAPGYIVAVRLANAYPTDKKEAQDAQTRKRSQEVTGNHNSFILVRHDIEETLPKKADAQGTSSASAQKPKRFTFYSLYMHLAPPDWSQPESYRDVSWHQALARRHGGLAVIDPQHESFRQVRWLQQLPPGDTGLTDTARLVAFSEGSFSILGAGAGLSQPLDLGKAEEGLVRAVWKKPDRDLEEIHQAMLESQVVTFSRPYLQVEAGELIGYVDEKSSLMDEGFIHWEILAPSGAGQLEAFLEFADKKLQLSEGGGKFFKFFEEKDSQDNYFQPGASGELASLVDLAPTSKHAQARDKKNLTRLRESSDPELLQEVLGSTRTLPFSADDEPASEPGYVTRIFFENFRGCLPAGAYKLKLTFEPSDCEAVEVDYDGKKESVDVVLPARARKIFVEPVFAEGSGMDFFLQTGNDSGQDSMRRDVEHFKKLASVRWRNVVLRHLNDWSVKGITAQLQARLKAEETLDFGPTSLSASDAEPARKAIANYANAIAWWAHEEKALLGSLQEKQNLFSEQGASAAEGQLPGETPLDNPHPITWAWLLMLLTRHGLMHFTSAPPWRSEEMKQVGALGWLPARQSLSTHRVGELVPLAAVQRGNGDEPVSVRVKLGALTLEVARGSFKEGLFIESVPVPGWGELSLDKPEGALELGAPRLRGLEPSLLWAPGPAGQGASRPSMTHESPALILPKGKNKDKAGLFSWRIPFRENCPKLLRGWILLRSWVGRADASVPTDVASFQVNDLAIPIEAHEDTSLETAGVELRDGFIHKGSLQKLDTYVTQHFTYKTFLDAARGRRSSDGTEPLLAWELAEAVERIQCAYLPFPLSLTGLAENGLSITLKAATKGGDALRKALETVNAEGRLEEIHEVGEGAFHVSVKPPPPGSLPGELVVEFNPDSAFEALKAGLAPEDKRVVMFGCFFPNGGGALDGRLLPTDTLGKNHVALNVEGLRSAAKAGFLEAWSTEAAQVLRRPGFGPPVLTLTDKGALISVQLIGAPDKFWKAADLVIHAGNVDLDKNEKVQFRSEAGSLYLMRLLELGTDTINGSRLAVEAEARKKDMILEGKKVNVEKSVRLNLAVQSKVTLQLTPKDDGSFVQVLTVKTDWLPIHRGFKLEIVNPRASARPGKPEASLVPLPKNALRYSSPAKKDGLTFGLTNAQGLLTIEFDESDLLAGLKGDTQYSLRVVAVSPQDKSLTRELKCTLHEELQARPEPDGAPAPAAGAGARR